METIQSTPNPYHSPDKHNGIFLEMAKMAGASRYVNRPAAPFFFPLRGIIAN